MGLCAGGEGRRFRVTDKVDVLQTAENITVSLVKGSIVTQRVSSHLLLNYFSDCARECDYETDNETD